MEAMTETVVSAVWQSNSDAVQQGQLSTFAKEAMMDVVEIAVGAVEKAAFANVVENVAKKKRREIDPYWYQKGLRVQSVTGYTLNGPSDHSREIRAVLQHESNMHEMGAYMTNKGFMDVQDDYPSKFTCQFMDFLTDCAQSKANKAPHAHWRKYSDFMTKLSDEQFEKEHDFAYIMPTCFPSANQKNAEVLRPDILQVILGHPGCRDRCHRVYERFWSSVGIVLGGSFKNIPSIIDPDLLTKKIRDGNHNRLRVSRALLFGRLMRFNYREMFSFLCSLVYNEQDNPKGILKISNEVVEHWNQNVYVDLPEPYRNC